MLALHLVEKRREARAPPARVVVIGRRLGQNGRFFHRRASAHSTTACNPPQTHLETFTRLPPRASRRPPLLFVHGGYVDGWCWTPHFLPWFAARGWPAHALSLRGHGGSGGAGMLFATGLDDYAADVERVAGSLPEPPILVGHSMGAAIVERMLAMHPLRAAVLLAPVPPTGLVPVAARLAMENPDYLAHMVSLDPMRLSADVLDALRPYYFSDRTDPAILAESTRHLTTSRRERSSTCRCGCTGSSPSATARSSWCSARGATASRRRTTRSDGAPPRRRAPRSCPASRTC